MHPNNLKYGVKSQTCGAGLDVDQPLVNINGIFGMGVPSASH